VASFRWHVLRMNFSIEPGKCADIFRDFTRNKNTVMNAELSTVDYVRGVLEDIFRRSGNQIEFENSDELISSGRLQSIQVIEVMLQLENHYGLDFSDYVFDPDDFESVESISAFISMNS